MSEYEKNTVGWWLSQLKEPLRSKALDLILKIRNIDPRPSLMHKCGSLLDAGDVICFVVEEDSKNHKAYSYMFLGNAIAHPNAEFWYGVCDLFRGDTCLPKASSLRKRGYNMAKECATDPIEADSPPAVAPSPDGKTGEEQQIGLLDIAIRNTTESFFAGMVAKPTQEQIEALRDEPIVHGYEPPKVVETIEGRHDREIKELQDRVEKLEDMWFKYFGSKNG